MATIPSTIGRYQIIELVGRGGMGVLYRARDPVLERDVALKMMHVDFTLDATARERFQREAKAVARLQHRNVVTIHELGEVDGTPYIVMEFLSGRDLDALLKGEVELSIVQKIDIAAQLCEGLAYAHDQGIIHRDIKPGNVRVLEDGIVKILDFGIAKFAMSSVTQSGTVMGTPSYMAPEQIMGQPLDGRADLFAVGVLLYELFTGAKPFSGDSPTAVVYQIMHVEPPSVREKVPDLPDAIEEIIARALQKDPNDRYARAAEMASDLQTVRMMLDLPLGSDRTPTGGLTAGTLPLHATALRPRTGGTPAGVLNTRIRPSAMAASADAAPRARAADLKSGSTMTIWIGAVAALVVLGVLGLFLIQGRDDGAAATDAGGKATADGGKDAAGGPPAPPPEITIRSVPPGARITIDGVDTGQVTPAAVPATLAASIGLTLDGYKPGSGEITDKDLAAGEREFRLAREPVAVRLTATGAFPFELVQGSKVISEAATEHAVTLPPGSGSVTARNRALFLDSRINVDYQRPQLSVTIPAAGQFAVFSAVETCTIVVDGQDLGFPPIQRRPIAAGAHTVVLKCPDGKGDTQKVTIAAGELSRVTFGPPKD